MTISQTPELLNPQQMETLLERTQVLWEKIKEEKPAAMFFLDKSAREFSFHLKIFNNNQSEPLRLPPVFPINFGSEKTELFTDFLLHQESSLKDVKPLSNEDERAKNHLQKHARTLKAFRIVDINNIRSFVTPDAFEELMAPFCTRKTLIHIYGEENIVRLEETLRDIADDSKRLIVDDFTYTGFSQVLLRSILTSLDSTHQYEFFEMFSESTLRQFTGESLYLPWTKSGNPHFQSAQYIEEPKDPKSFIVHLTKKMDQRERAFQFRKEIRNHFGSSEE